MRAWEACSVQCDAAQQGRGGRSTDPKWGLASWDPNWDPCAGGAGAAPWRKGICSGSEPRAGDEAGPTRTTRRGQQGDSFLSFHQGLRWTQAGGHGDLVPVPEHTASPGAHRDVLHCGTQGGNRSLWGSGSVSPQKRIQSKEGLTLDRLDDEQMSFL